jgi:hypothetical protein
MNKIPPPLLSPTTDVGVGNWHMLRGGGFMSRPSVKPDGGSQAYCSGKHVNGVGETGLRTRRLRHG